MSVTTGPSTALRTPESGRTQPHHPETDPADTRGGASTGVRRRTLAKGAMWAVPAVALAVPAPAYAASTDVYGGRVCKLAYGTGTVNYQVLHMWLGVSSSTAIVPQGATFTWTITMPTSVAYHEVPTPNYSANARWTVALDPVQDTTTGSFTVTLKVVATNVSATELSCPLELTWQNVTMISPGSRITVTGMTSLQSSSDGKSQASYLAFDVAKRFYTSNSPNRAHRYIQGGGIQRVYPAIEYTSMDRTNRTACGDGQSDTSTYYPDGTCVNTQTPGSNQTTGVVPERTIT